MVALRTQTFAVTVVFASTIFGLLALMLPNWMRGDRQFYWNWGLVATATACAVTPLVWSKLVSRRGRPSPGYGSLAGVVCWVTSVVVVPLAWAFAYQWFRTSGQVSDLYFLDGIAAITIFLLPLAAMIGAVEGGLVAGVLRTWMSSTPPMDH